MDPYSSFGKRLVDVTLSGAALIIGSPIFGVVGIVARFTQGSPVLFRQVRAGRNGEPFTILKFRTMQPESADLSPTLRVTRLGRLLRRTSLDEIPQLMNVLKGDMSLVGPRPLHLRYVSRYSPRQSRRLEVRPGLTGLAQINGRNNLSWAQRFELDALYVDKLSLLADIRIFARTVLLLMRSGSARATAPGYEFYADTSSAPSELE